MKFSSVVVFTLLLGASVAEAYELGTHARLTNAAYGRSMLKDSEFLKQLGIDSADPEPFGTAYYDVFGVNVTERERHAFERRFMPENAQPLSVVGWLMRGAIREDDHLEPTNGQPVDDPYNVGNQLIDGRPLNHFYDPVRDIPLRTFVELGRKAPDWGVGSEDVFRQPNTPQEGRRNHFTIFDAREAMYRALTGRNKEGQVVADTKEKRSRYWATTFRALGDVVHLIQDMSQPQHTRNDAHAGARFDEREGFLGLRGHRSVYELYVEARATGGAFTTVGNATLPDPITINPPPLDHGSYVTPRFTDYVSFFTTRHLDGDSIPARRGMADYSNRGFFSAGTNIGDRDNVYSYPPRDRRSYARQETNHDPWLNRPIGNDPNNKVELLLHDVQDSLPGGQSVANVPVTTYGIWDQFLQVQQESPRYTLNRYNYDAMAAQLIPRAVAYSAGLIDYFFRGRLEAEDAGYTERGLI